jgi:hypothetical protein
MIRISLTDFVDFVISAGSPKLTKVNQVKKRGAYNAATDFWRGLRNGIVSFHRAHTTDKRQLDRILTTVHDENKIPRYQESIRGYKRFLGRKTVSWFSPPSTTWGPRGIQISINPELGLNINGTRHIIKLYFKSEKLSKRRADIVLLLLNVALRDQISYHATYGLLDVPRGRLFANTSPNSTLLPLLRAEAISFVSIWEDI